MKIRNILLTVILGIGLTGNAIADLNEGLVAYYPFDGNANDESDSAYHGVVNGAKLTTDRFGRLDSAYAFDGLDDNIITNSTIGDGATQISVILWFKSVSLNTSFSGILGRDRGGVNTDDVWNILLAFDEIRPEVVEKGNEEFSLPHRIDTLWHNLAMIYNGTEKSLKIYYDGGLVSQLTTVVGILNSTPSLKLTIGSYSNSTFMFNGSIDDIRIYDRALSEPEVQELYLENTDNCTEYTDSTVTPNLDIHLPSLNYQSLTNTLNLWVDLEFYGINGNDLLWKLNDYGEHKGSDVACESEDTITVSPNLDIQLLSIDYQLLAGTISLWANFEYYGLTSQGELLWKLLDYGENQ